MKSIIGHGDDTIEIHSIDGKVVEPIGMKFDDNKPNYLNIFRYLKWDFLVDVAEVAYFGAKKYSKDNWMDVNPERYKKALARHTKSYLEGEILDPETKLPHVAHIACNCMFLWWHDVVGKK